MDDRIVSTTPGRVRIRLAALRGQPELGRTVSDQLATLDGVRTVSASARTGTLLVTFAPSDLTDGQVLAAAAAACMRAESGGTPRSKHLRLVASAGWHAPFATVSSFLPVPLSPGAR